MTELHFKMDKQEATELLWLLNRALNSLQPEKWPASAQELLNHLEKYVNGQ